MASEQHDLASRNPAAEQSSALRYSAPEFWDRWERLTAPVTEELVADAEIGAGEHVVDIGCGAGLATFAAAAAVGASGTVVAFDLSTDALAILRARAVEQGAANVETAQGDMERDNIPGAPFDLALNQFGLTFVTDLTATFSRIRRQLKTRGRCVFAAWATADQNPLLPMPLLADYRVGAADQDPFAMADPAATRAVLRQAGFEDVSSRAVEITSVVPLEAIFDDSMLVPLGLDEPESARVRGEILGRIATFATSGGYAVPLVFHIFSAVNPG